jgi:hypothetical protein
VWGVPRIRKEFHRMREEFQRNRKRKGKRMKVPESFEVNKQRFPKWGKYLG